MTTRPSSPTEAQWLQYAIAFVFLSLGGWCLFAPASIIAFGVREAWQTDHPIAIIAIGAFGAQAMLAGLFAAFSVFTRRTFAAFGAALLPFFVFDYWYYAVEPILNAFILLDVIGNVAMLTLCIRGYAVLGPKPASPR